MSLPLTQDQIRVFRETIYARHRANPRSFPWRETNDPYRILVSEMMLQQTQVERVRVKYDEFLGAFPDFRSLAAATLRDILSVWQGLGYNRRALYLHRIARIVVGSFGSALPTDPKVLESLPGIGHTTAREIAAFAFRIPVAFIETNIRRVFIHFFFRGRERVRDRDILPLVEATLDAENPREWFYAHMDYGVMLKKTSPNPNLRSAHYHRQSPFHGSTRQVRGMILRLLASEPGLAAQEIAKRIGKDAESTAKALRELANEGFLTEDESGFRIR